MNVLLLENKYKKKYRNLALMKFSTYYKRQGYNVDYYNGIDKKNTLKDDYDIIIYSTIFTFYFHEDIKTITYYKNKYPNANIMIGGVSASLLPDKFFEETNIMPHQGIYEPVEYLPPDYNLFPEHKMKNVSEVFSARGCKNNCAFCAVRILEPDYLINEQWRDSIDLTKSKVMIHDNNLITGSYEHFKDVTTFVTENKLITTFDNGFDCRKFTEEHLKHIINIKFDRGGLRFAFDNMSEDEHIQRTIKMCLNAGIGKSKIMVFLLYNYKDDFEEAMYRAEEIKKLGVRPYPQQYRPLDDTELKNNYISKHWDKKLLRDFRFYWMFPGIYGKQKWEDYIKNGGANAYGDKKINSNEVVN